MEDNGMSFKEWFNIGKMTGMFDFNAPGLKDADLTYSEAMQFLGMLQDMQSAGIISNEKSIEALDKASVTSYFRDLVEDDPRVRYEEIGTGQIPGWRYRVRATYNDVISVLRTGESTFVICEGSVEVKTCKTKEEAGVYVLKWILNKETID